MLPAGQLVWSRRWLGAALEEAWTCTRRVMPSVFHLSGDRFARVRSSLWMAMNSRLRTGTDLEVSKQSSTFREPICWQDWLGLDEGAWKQGNH